MLYWLLFEKLFPHFGPFRLFGYADLPDRVRQHHGPVNFDCARALADPQAARVSDRAAYSRGRAEVAPQEGRHANHGRHTDRGLHCVPALLWTNLRNPYVWVALFGLVSFGAIGFWDDYTKVRKMRNLGISGRTKFGLQALAALLIGFWLLGLHARGLYSTEMNVPFFKQFRPNMLIDHFLATPFTYPLAFVFFFGFVIFVLVGSSNAVNLTDGLDGLAIGLMIIAAGAMTVLSYVSGHAAFATYLDIARLPGASELAVFCGAMTGASLGFLWYNAHPAEIFMGDVGSLALGGAMGVIAVLINRKYFWSSVGGVFVIEALSVILQVGSFKLRGKRIFKMAPLHHHFEALGWQEAKIITRFWIAGLVMALFALTTLKLR